MARARRVSLFEREIRIGLSSAAIEILFSQASILSEGQVEPGGYYGSTMITIDCARARELCSDPCDASTVKRVSALLLADARFCDRARHIGQREASRMAGEALSQPQIDLRARTSGSHIHIDVDVEATTVATARAQ